MKYICCRCVRVLAFFVAFATLSYAQEATIVGTVTDPTGSVIPNASITITNVETGVARSTTSNQAGQYVVPDLRIGKYTVKVEVSGFRATERTGVVLTSHVHGELHVQQSPRNP
jgi:hypothetical protein